MDSVIAARQGLAAIAGFLDEIRRPASASWEQYQADPNLRRATERLLELLLVAGADAAQWYLRINSIDPGDTEAEAFQALVWPGVISQSMSVELCELSYEHSIFANAYFGLDDRRIYELPQAAEPLFTSFAVAVEQALPPSVPGDTP